MAQAQVDQQVGGWHINVWNRFTSEAFLLNETVNDIRDENITRWEVMRPLGGRTAGMVYGQAGWFSQNQASGQALYGALRYQVHPLAWIAPALGMAWDRRLGVADSLGHAPVRLDAGPAFGIRLETRPVPVGEYRAQINLAGHWQLINPRRGRTVQADAGLHRRYQRSRFTVTARYANFRRDAYQATSFLNRDPSAIRSPEAIEATTSDTLLTQVSFDTPLRRHWALQTRLDIATNHRFIRTFKVPKEALFFDTDFTRRELDAEIATRYQNGAADARIAVYYGAAVERRQLANREDLPLSQAGPKGDLLQQADYDEGDWGIRVRSLFPLGTRWTLRFSGTANLLQHDTPDRNPDDRDEVFHNAELGVRARFSEALQADMEVFGTYDHTVYLRAARSAENSRRFSLRLRPSLRWRPSPNTDVQLNSSVRATYTVDDFELPNQTPNDQSARELRYTGSLMQRLTNGVVLRAEGNWGHLLLGRLLWEDFAEIPFDTLRTTSGWVRLQVGQRWTAEAGVRFFVRRDFDRAVSVRYDRPDGGGQGLVTRSGREWIEQIGPTAAFTWPMAGGSELRIDGWLQVQRVRQALFGDLPEDEVSEIEAAASRGTRRVVPNVRMQVIWRF